MNKESSSWCSVPSILLIPLQILNIHLIWVHFTYYTTLAIFVSLSEYIIESLPGTVAIHEWTRKSIWFAAVIFGRAYTYMFPRHEIFERKQTVKYYTDMCFKRNENWSTKNTVSKNAIQKFDTVTHITRCICNQLILRRVRSHTFYYPGCLARKTYWIFTGICLKLFWLEFNGFIVREKNLKFKFEIHRSLLVLKANVNKGWHFNKWCGYLRFAFTINMCYYFET